MAYSVRNTVIVKIGFPGTGSPVRNVPAVKLIDGMPPDVTLLFRKNNANLLSSIFQALPAPRRAAA